MKVLQLGKYFFPHKGGVETYTKMIVDECKKVKIDVEVIVSNNLNETKVDYVDGTRVLRLRRLLELFHAPFTTSPIKHIIKSNADIIHLHVPHPWFEFNLLLCFLISGKKEKLVVTYHADAPHYTFIHTIFDFFRSFMLIPLLKFFADTIVATSPNYTRGSKTLSKLRDKTLIIPFGIDTKISRYNTRKIRKKFNLSNKKIILFVGRLYPYKGLEYLIEAMKLLVRKRDDIKLLIVGRGELRNKLESLVYSLTLKDFVIFTNELKNKELHSLYETCDVFVLPSINRGEAFGIVQLEAMVHKKPVISTNIEGSGVTFVNKHNKTGLIVQPRNPKELADSISYLLNNPKIAKKMGRAGRKRVNELFRKDKMIKKIINLYKNFL